MSSRSTLTLMLAVALLASLCGVEPQAGEKKKEDKRGGTVVGVLTEKGKDFIKVKSPGEEEARRYVPHWVGGTPAQGGGFDKKILKLFEGLKVGDRVRLEWNFEERPRVISIELLKTEDKKQ
jgi:hypothetical protein